MTDDELVGRTGLVERARTRLETSGSVLLYGPTGIGKSALARALVADRTRAGWRVLSAAPSQSEAGLPYVTLLDLLSNQLELAWQVLPDHLRQPLEVALLKASAPDTVRDELAVRLAVLHVLRRLAASGPVLLVVDDIQWVDPSSLEVLTFCARRLTDGVHMLATEQVADGDLPVMAEACPEPVLQLEVPPLAEPDVLALLRNRLSSPLPVRTARRIHTASGGSPFMALELGRAVLRHPQGVSPNDPLPVSSRLKTLLGDRLADLGPATHELLLHASASPRPTTAQLAQSLGRPIEAELAEAEGLGLIDVSSDRLRFSHPLLREFVYAEATSAARRQAHARLAAVVEEPVEKATHRALATQEADADLAAALEDAAATAGARGALGAAATLWRLAAERTPAAEPDDRARRLTRAADDAAAAGHLVESAEMARQAVQCATRPDVKVPALLLLVDAAWPEREQRIELLAEAFEAAAGDDRLEAQVRIVRSHSAYFDRRLDDAREDARVAEQLARRCGDTEALVDALSAAHPVEIAVGGGQASDRLLGQAGELALGLPLTKTVVHARQMAAMRELFRGNTAAAIEGIGPLVEEVRDGGAVRWLAGILISATAIYERSGHGAEALAAGHECLQLMQDLGDEPEVGLVIAARAEWAGGTATTARELAEAALEAVRVIGNDEWTGPALASVGLVGVLTGDPQRAVEAFDAIADSGEAAMPYDPAVIPWHADYAEALVACGRLDDAAALLADIRERAETLDREVVRVGLARSEALLIAKRGDPAAALDLLEKTLAGVGDRVYPLDLARCELTRGRVARQARRRSVARSAFLDAIEQFEAYGAPAWREVAETELARLDVPSRSRQPSELTDNELQIVAMVRDGSTNREIAAALYLSVKAVESQLTRLYRRFGVANRTQLLRTVDRGGTDLAQR
ncbi:transcriptional regulator, LuxR family [Kribbella flavida DSM 17836]|uniref:Transcriptional regulator, LuxR family n=1 Tax=Kribbella flavida (strain DSM 17836 / JCM 10339 / NBRC 14399) TaxID=479435 RepID=D2PKC1_KRIFD|nr:LuxR family transcriptional regulator [Kribbella flavida]ADB30433.1 transcriptional regulator, LuxR family [Kribbella flavida DSM 17836]